jgi:hypothetical protein
MFSIFDFCFAPAEFQLAGASADVVAMESGREEVHAAKSPSPREPPADIEIATPHDTSVLDIALVSGHAGTVDRDAVCGLLTKCLQDVSFAMFVMPYLVICCWVFNVSLFLYQAVKLTKLAKTIIVQDSRLSLCQHITELKAENSRLKDAATESAEMIGMLQRAS